MRFLRDLRPAAFAVAPLVGAALTLAAGIMLLASGATPSEPVRFMRLLELAPVGANDIRAEAERFNGPSGLLAKSASVAEASTRDDSGPVEVRDASRIVGSAPVAEKVTLF